MRKYLLILLFTVSVHTVHAQCAVCKNTAASLDDKAAKGMNVGILFLAAMPLTIMGVIGYRWWKQHKETI